MVKFFCIKKILKKILGDHTFECVPFAVSSVGLMTDEEKGIDHGVKDGSVKYDELEFVKGSLGRFAGIETMQFVKRCSEYFYNKVNSKS